MVEYCHVGAKRVTCKGPHKGVISLSLSLPWQIQDTCNRSRRSRPRRRSRRSPRSPVPRPAPGHFYFLCGCWCGESGGRSLGGAEGGAGPEQALWTGRRPVAGAPPGGGAARGARHAGRGRGAVGAAARPISPGNGRRCASRPDGRGAPARRRRSRSSSSGSSSPSSTGRPGSSQSPSPRQRRERLSSSFFFSFLPLHDGRMPPLRSSGGSTAAACVHLTVCCKQPLKPRRAAGRGGSIAAKGRPSRSRS